MQDEFKRLFEMFQKTQQGKHVDLDEMLKESVLFFDKLKDTFKTGSEEEKQELLRVMNEMHSRLSQQAKLIAEHMKIDEEQLYTFCENPNNFTADQWQTMQEARKKVMESGKVLSKFLRGVDTNVPDEEEKSKPKVRKLKKDKWMRS